jgi:hypothetical protein
MFIEGGLPPRVSKLVNVAKYRHFDFDMGFVTALQASTAGFERGVGDVSKGRFLIHTYSTKNDRL